MSTLRIFTHFMQLRKLGLLFKTSILLKPEFLINVPQAKYFIIDLIIHLKTLPKCQKRKKFKKQVFGAKKAQPIKEPVDRLCLFGRGRSKSLSLFQQPFLPDRWDSLPGRYPVEAMVTCKALNAPTASELVDPQLDRTRLPFVVFDSRAQKLIN